MNLQDISSKIKKYALEIGFNDCGFAKVEELTFNKQKLYFSINNGYTAKLSFLSRNVDKRANPAILFENAKTVIIVLASYFPKKIQNEKKYKISIYSYSNNYHNIIKNNLNKLFFKLKEVFPDVIGRVFCDTAPIFEKEWAKRAGLGWLGKNNLLINENLGTFVFIGGILIDKELYYDNAFEKTCGNCNLCIESCPTKALSPYLLDVNKCISYITIENTNNKIPESFKGKIKNEIYGCDICQNVCPHNKKLNDRANHFFKPNEYVNWNEENWENLNEEKFKSVFKDTAIVRIGLKKLKRNIEFVNRNNKLQQ